jgi:hypothetical protein
LSNLPDSFISNVKEGENRFWMDSSSQMDIRSVESEVILNVPEISREQKPSSQNTYEENVVKNVDNNGSTMFEDYQRFNPEGNMKKRNKKEKI